MKTNYCQSSAGRQDINCLRQNFRQSIYLIIDSARYDTFTAARTPAFDNLGKAERRYPELRVRYRYLYPEDRLIPWVAGNP